MTQAVSVCEQDTVQAMWISTILSVVQIAGVLCITLGRSWDPHLYWGLYLIWGAAAIAKLFINESYSIYREYRILNWVAAAAGVGLFLIGLTKLAAL